VSCAHYCHMKCINTCARVAVLEDLAFQAAAEVDVPAGASGLPTTCCFGLMTRVSCTTTYDVYTFVLRMTTPTASQLHNFTQPH
jgi:hypothetical protein